MAERLGKIRLRRTRQRHFASIQPLMHLYLTELRRALLDAELLAEVYLCMTRGQELLLMDIGLVADVSAEKQLTGGAFELIVITATEEELTLHARSLEDIDASSRGACLWKPLDAATPPAVAA
jgi:DNA polymerase III epsilon subunit-like protein